MTRTRHLSALLLLAVVSGCAKERAPIDRTQPDFMKKSFLVGDKLDDPADDPEFWAQGTLIKVGYGAAQDGLFTSTYAQPVTRIKWVIQENELVGRLSYERIDDSDHLGAGPASRDGQVAYVYKIIAHFDRRRAYNPLTGEELNVLEENTSDRPWYQREFVRVDWSKNLNEDAYDLDTLSQVGVSGGIKYEPLAYYVNDPTDPDAPHLDPADNYFDITNKAFAKPATIDLSFWGLGEYPLCFFNADFAGGSAPAGNCNPVELTIRNAFRKVLDTDYEPAEWDGFRFQSFGAFTVERHGYARNYGMSDEKWRRFIARYDIWERSHAYQDAEKMTGPTACFTPETTPRGADPHRDTDGNGTEDECEAIGRGSRCDEFRQRCTLPFRDRKPQPIVWYYTNTSDPEYFEPTKDAAREWDVALRSAVMTARYSECARVEANPATCQTSNPMYFGQQDHNDDAIALVTEVEACREGRAYAGEDCAALAERLGAARGYDPAVMRLAQMQRMVIICHSPVAAGDAAECGPTGLLVRQGDLRYHQLNVIPTPQTPSPWGIMVDSVDPLTGQKIAASINVWSAVNDVWSQGVVDRLRYGSGELAASEITEGKNVADWVQADRAAGRGGLLPRLSKADLDRRLADFAGTTPGALGVAAQALAGQGSLLTKMGALDRQIGAVRADATRQASTESVYEARRRRALGGAVEAELNNREMRALAGVASLPVNEETLRFSSPLQGTSPAMTRQLRQARELRLAERGACIRSEAPVAESLSGLGDLLEEKFGAFSRADERSVQDARAERMRKYLAHRAHTSVILHEMGHSIGLRHNFISSADAWGYRPQYWQLRTRNGSDLPECADRVEDGAACVGPRWFDPYTSEEQRQLIGMFMQSSVMDYAGNATQDLLGLGAYDFAAARSFYADAVAVHADPSYQASEPRGLAMIDKADQFGGILGLRWSTDGDVARHGIHYSQLQRSFDLIKDCRSVDAAQYRPAAWDEAAKGQWHPLLDGGLVSVDGNTTRCAQQKVDYVAWTKLQDAEAQGDSHDKGPTVDAKGRTRVPYGFATDRWADLGNLAVYRHDNGADAYELFDFFITEQEVNHIFDNYRRGREGFSVRSAVTRTLERYNEKMRDGAKGLGLYANIYRDFALAEGYDFETLWPAIVGNARGGYNALATNVLASQMAFDHFTRQMARPEAGEHYLPPGESVLRSSSASLGNPGDTVMVVPNGAMGTAAGAGIGGRPVENGLAQGKGEYGNEYTVNAGSYYEKVYSTMLLTESVDNFVSASRTDFVDARFRAVSMADLFPQAYRRWLANNLTNDNVTKASWIASERGQPMVDPDSKMPMSPLAYTSWIAASPQVCGSSGGVEACSGNESFTAIDPQVGWEEQKFLIAWTLLYLPENQQRGWLDMLGVWDLGDDSDPGFANRIELHDPAGRVFIAKTFGKETVFGKSVQRGIAARTLEYGNELLVRAYETDPGPDLDHDGKPDWYTVHLGPSGVPVVKYDPSIASITAQGGVSPGGRPGCDRQSSAGCSCSDNRACVELSRYVAVPSFLRQALGDFGLADPSMRGLR